MEKEYFFIPGRNRLLSKAELQAVLRISDINVISINYKPEEFFILETDSDITFVKGLFDRLGGFIKFGEILSDTVTITSIVEKYPEKFIYSVSSYSAKKGDREVKSQNQSIKQNIRKTIKSAGRKGRYIGKNERKISAGQIVGNQLLEKGFELVTLHDLEGNIRFGETLAVQDIEGYRFRDLKKPALDSSMGVLPHKLARIMINMTSVEEGSVIWDPFCGSGNILLEGMVLGYDVIGTDIDQTAVDNSLQNIDWLSSVVELNEARYSVFQLDISKVPKSTHKRLRNSEISAVVFEPYMGPPMKRIISAQYAQEHLDHAVELFKHAVWISERLKSPKINLVGIIPSYKTKDGWLTCRFNELFTKKWEIQQFSGGDEGLHWDRSSSIIRRNLIVAKLKN